MDLLQVHETQAEICNVIFISHCEQSFSFVAVSLFQASLLSTLLFSEI